MMMNLYAISFYLLISCLTSVNGYVGTIKSVDGDICVSAIGIPVPGQAVGTSVIYFDCKLNLNLNMTYRN